MPSPTATPPVPIVVHPVPVEAALHRVWAFTADPSPDPWVVEPVVAPNGDIWAPRSLHDEFVIATKDGRAAGSWGVAGTEPGQFKLAANGSGWGAVAFRSDGGFYIADSGNNRIQQFGKDRDLIKVWGQFGTKDGQLIDPLDIAVDAANHVYVMCDSRHDLQVFDENGTFIRRLASDVGPYLSVSPDGTAYVDTNNAFAGLEVFAPDGTWTATWDLHEVIRFATDVDVTPSGRIFVASATTGDGPGDYDKLIELDRTGRLVHVWPNGAEGLAINAAEDRLYETFVEKMNGQLLAIDLPPS